MEDINNLPKEFFKPLIPCLDLLKACNITIFEEKKTFLKKLRYVFVFICLTSFYVSQSVYLRKVFDGNLHLFELIFIVPVFVGITEAISKAIVVSSNKIKIKKLIFQLGNVWRTENLTRVQLEKKKSLLKRLKFCYKAFYGLNVCFSLQYMLAPLIETIYRRFIMVEECDLQLPFACSFPFDPTENWFSYITIYLLEVYSMFLVIYCYLGSEFLMIILCGHLSTEFTLLTEDLLHLVPITSGHRMNEDDHMKVQRELKCVVQKHQILIKLSEQLDDIFNKMIFINLLAATILICFFGFSAKVAPSPLGMVKNLPGVAVSISPIFNLCYYADLLRQASSRMADSAYNNMWYEGNTQYRKSIFIILLRSQKPCCMTSMKYNPITLDTFTAVLSTTWSYFSLISSVYDD